MGERSQNDSDPEDEARPPTAATEDAKARFREALERKRSAAHRTADGAPGGSTVHGPEVSGTSRRVFRRKSG